MAESNYLPYHFVNYLRSPGLQAKAGTIPLAQYLCKTKSNGGNDSATSLIGKLRWMKDGGTGSQMNTLVGGIAVDLALKGQGSGETFIAIWDFMCRNKEQLKKLDVEVCGRRDRGDTDKKVVLKTGNVYDLYFKGKSDKAAIQAMIADRFFGIDCIGFTGTFLMYTGEWTKYKGATPRQWADWHCSKKINHAKDIKPLDFMIWTGGGHIAIVDWVWSMVDDKTVKVDVCQSSSGELTGPQCNEFVHLREGSIDGTGRRQYYISHRGSPRMPVDGHVYVMRRNGFFW